MARTRQTAKKTTGGAARRVKLKEQRVVPLAIPRLASMRASALPGPATDPSSSLQVSVYHWHV